MKKYVILQQVGHIQLQLRKQVCLFCVLSFVMLTSEWIAVSYNLKFYKFCDIYGQKIMQEV